MHGRLGHVQVIVGSVNVHETYAAVASVGIWALVERRAAAVKFRSIGRGVTRLK